ncbi:MAG TPA: outer membrane lipoprotein carrier protein LolA [Kofleriaceae bacterium]
MRRVAPVLAAIAIAIAPGLAIAAPSPSASPGTPAPPARPGASNEPPANLLSGKPAHGAAVDPVFARLQLQRLRCTFHDEKHIALLARPLQSTGVITFDRDRGIVRSTTAPHAEKAVLTRTALRIQRGDHVEDIPLDRSKDLQAFALIFPTLLRGERQDIERSFDLALYGRADGWWALELTPRADSLRALVRRVVVFGRAGELVALQIAEASGDTTDTRLSEVHKNGDVPDAEIAAAFGAP